MHQTTAFWTPHPSSWWGLNTASTCYDTDTVRWPSIPVDGHQNIRKAANDWVNSEQPPTFGNDKYIYILRRHACEHGHKSAFLEPLLTLRSIALHHSTVLVCPTVLQTHSGSAQTHMPLAYKFGVSRSSQLWFKHFFRHFPAALWYLNMPGLEGRGRWGRTQIRKQPTEVPPPPDSALSQSSNALATSYVYL